MADDQSQGAHDHEFVEVDRPEGRPAHHLELDDLKGVRLDISAELGARKMLVREVLELKRGAIVPLDKVAGEPADIFLNGVPLAKGEIVVIGDTLHVRIIEIIGTNAKGEAKSGDA